jgi:hypothetical protein
MEKDKLIKEFFIENEKKFKEEDILRLIGKLNKFAKIVGKEGKVHVEKTFKGSGTDRLKLFLIVRYLAGELSKLKPELGIRRDVANITIDDVVEFLSLPDKHNARARMSALVKEDFAERIRKGVIRVRSYQIERFIEYLETPKKELKKVVKKITRIRRKREKPIKEEKIDRDKIYKRLSKNLDIDEKKLKDVLLINEDGSFKFNEVVGKSKREKQKNCILCTSYVVSVGFGKEKINSKIIRDVCFNSYIDITGLRFTLRDLVRSDYLTKAKKGSQENRLREKGKVVAKNIFQKLCKVT